MVSQCLFDGAYYLHTIVCISLHLQTNLTLNSSLVPAILSGLGGVELCKNNRLVLLLNNVAVFMSSTGLPVVKRVDPGCLLPFIIMIHFIIRTRRTEKLNPQSDIMNTLPLFPTHIHEAHIYTCRTCSK